VARSVIRLANWTGVGKGVISPDIEHTNYSWNCYMRLKSSLRNAYTLELIVENR